MLSIDCDQAVGLRSAVRWFLESGVTDVETNYKSILPLNINPKHLPLNNTELYLNRGNPYRCMLLYIAVRVTIDKKRGVLQTNPS